MGKTCTCEGNRGRSVEIKPKKIGEKFFTGYCLQGNLWMVTGFLLMTGNKIKEGKKIRNCCKIKGAVKKE